MNRNEAKELAQTVSIYELKEMFVNAQNGITDWTKISSVNKGLTKGTSFNILTTGGINKDTHMMARINMIREFGEWLPNYQKKLSVIREQPIPIHQEPIKLPEDFLK